MKFRLVVKLAEMILGQAYSDDNPRADMCLPVWLLGMAIVLSTVGGVLGVMTALAFSATKAMGAVVCIVLGVAALLCWKNQTITVLSDTSFEYSDMFGKKTVYYFKDIKGIKKNNDSMTMFVGDGKVHIESSAIITDRLANLINAQLDSLYGNQQ